MGGGPGKAYRGGLSMRQLLKLFPNDDAARQWFEAQIWPDGPNCPYCGSVNVQCGIKHPTMTHRCRDCPKRRMFSLKSRTVMQGSPLGYQTWALAIYLVTTSLKGVSSMKLHRDLEISQKSAWYLAHRIREAWKREQSPFLGPAEADETFMGGKRKNMPQAKRKALREAGAGRGAVGKTVVAGVKDRRTNKVSAAVVAGTDARTLQAFVEDRVVDDAKLYTDEHGAYRNMPYFEHEAVSHGTGEYVRGQVHTNGIESFWSMLKRAHMGTFHQISAKHMQRYITEFAGRHNARERDTLAQMGELARGMIGRRLTYRELIADNGLPSGARGA